MTVRPARAIPLAAGLLAAGLLVGLPGCTPDDRQGPTPVPTTAVPTAVPDGEETVCGVSRRSIEAVTGYPVGEVRGGFTGSGRQTRGSCSVVGEGHGAVGSTFGVTLHDADSEQGRYVRRVLDPSTRKPPSRPFAGLDGGIYGQVDPTVRRDATGTASGVFVGGTLVQVSASTLAPGRVPLEDFEALARQVIASTGLDGDA